jgi:hypothetical protein
MSTGIRLHSIRDRREGVRGPLRELLTWGVGGRKRREPGTRREAGPGPVNRKNRSRGRPAPCRAQNRRAPWPLPQAGSGPWPVRAASRSLRTWAAAIDVHSDINLGCDTQRRSESNLYSSGAYSAKGPGVAACHQCPCFRISDSLEPPRLTLRAKRFILRRATN